MTGRHAVPEAIPQESPAPAAAPAQEAAPGFSGRLTAPLLIGSLLNPLNTTMISTALVAIGHHFVSRLLLGIGTSAAYPAAMAVLRDESARIGRATPRSVLARLSFAALGSAAVGPTLGGLLVMAVGWRGIFAVNVPVALVAFGAALLWIPADPPRRRAADGGTPRLGLDPLGIGLFTAALTVLVFFLLDLAHPVWWLLAPFAVLTAALVRWQLRRPDPFIDLRMLAGNAALSRTYLRHGASYLLIYCVMYGYTQWLEEARGYSSGHTGLLMLPMSVAALVCSLLGARTKGIRGPLTLACVLLTVGAGVLMFLSGDTPLAVLLLAGACFGIPQGLIGTSNQAAVQAYAPAEVIGSAAGLQRTAQYIGAITASSLIALAYGQSAGDHGLHLMAGVAAVLGVLLIVLTVTDRALRGRT
ncbi:MFS transporter [Streptomyces sp. NBC_01285]|uniref:MFS transporter n=1 Tax=Streptomyces sp. NBC_01285 TaxID=2903813 RepID=UPI0022510BD4|nr:MFS transporter [Streptomyces sp. NBC_01285]MCX4770075.1 MFS transporter [Streptomyces sp. NBC_01285]